MADEPKLMTKAELAELDREVGDFITGNINPPETEPRGKLGVFRAASFWQRLIHQASQSLGLQERAEKAEAEVAELRAERNEYFRRLVAIGELRQ